MTWRDAARAWAPNVPLDAHLASTLQVQLQAVYDSSGSDVSSGMLRPTYSAVTATGDWLWSSLRIRPTRVLRKQGDLAWRDVTVEVFARLAAPGKTTLRLVACHSGGVPISTAGDVTPAGLDFDDLSWTDAAPKRVAGTVTPTLIALQPLRGVVTPIVYLRFAVTGNQPLWVYDVRVKEAA